MIIPTLRKIASSLCLLVLSPLFAGCDSDTEPGLFSSMGYHVTKTKVWQKSPRSDLGVFSVHEVVGADPRTFVSKTITNREGQSQVIGFDAKSVFWGYEQVVGADPTTFEYVGNEYFKDKSHAYYLATPITDDVSHFELYEEFARDSTTIYFGSTVFSKDAANFTRVGPSSSRFYKDSARCWFSINPISEADPATLDYLVRDYARDATHVFYQMNTIESADSATFEPLVHDFSRDAHSVFLQSFRIEGADPATFRVLDETTGSDKDHCYYNGQLLPDADPTTFRLIDDFYSTDSQHVWVNGTLIEGADPKTFRVIDGPAGKSRDAMFEYDMTQKAVPAK